MSKGKHNGGFTLIEIIVSLAVFSVVTLIILGAVLSIMSLQKRTNAFRVAQENLSYAFESMIKETRTGNTYKHLGTDPQTIKFTNIDNNIVVYRLDTVKGQIVKCTTPLSADTACDNPATGNFMPLTSDEVVINQLLIGIEGTTVSGSPSQGDGEQPMTRFYVSATVGSGTKFESKLYLQTSSTQRKADI